MPIYGEMGPVDKIWCDIERGLAQDEVYGQHHPAVETVRDGEIVDQVTQFINPSEHQFIADNCPRLNGSDTTKPLGCIGCTHAAVVYENGMMECQASHKRFPL